MEVSTGENGRVKRIRSSQSTANRLDRWHSDSPYRRAVLRTNETLGEFSRKSLQARNFTREKGGFCAMSRAVQRNGIEKRGCKAQPA
ncbi:unnamed protein product [Lasius platythorax]|uniref:Uncharacterized protein n=1 Tax=Lasius platythorax TaxID=488582 RepID=A0AAV2NCX8_9HYME